MPVLWNPTNEDFDTIFEGVPATIHGVSEQYPTGQKVKVDKSRAGHLMNVYEKRGLAQLEYGDDVSGMEKTKGLAAVKRNGEFKEKQVISYNTDNERRKQAGQSFIDPTPQVVKYAAERGVELLSPYAVKTDESKRVASLEKDNQALRDQMTAMMDKMTVMMDKFGGEVPADKTKEELDFDRMRNSFIKLGADNFKSWLIKNKEEVLAWPRDLQTAVHDKWVKAFPNEECLLDIK